jgi:sortase A
MSPGSIARNHAGKLRTRILRGAYYMFLTSGMAGLTYAGYIYADAYSYQAREQTAFELAQVKSVSEQRRPAINGEIMGEMEVARLGLKAIVVQGDSPAILRRAVGHVPGTPLPGESGNVALAGHRDTFFRPLRDIRKGDAITFKTLTGKLRYQVESTEIVSPSDTSVLQSLGGRTLTLITCFPFYYIGPAANRFIVRARQVETWPEQVRTR